MRKSDEPSLERMRRDENRQEWDWSADEIKRVGYRVIDLIAEHITTLPAKPVFRPLPRDFAAKRLDSAPPASGESPDAILDAFENEIAPFPFGNGHPRFYGWVNPPPALMGNAGLSRPNGVDGAAASRPGGIPKVNRARHRHG